MVFLQVFFDFISAQASKQEQERCSNSGNFVFWYTSFSLLFFFWFKQRMLDTPQQQSQLFTCQSSLNMLIFPLVNQ
jgi:hypothetical protein